MSGGGGEGSTAAEKGPSLASVAGAQYSPQERYQARYEPLQSRQPAQQFQIPSLDQMGQFQQQLNQFQQPGNLAGLQAVFAQMMAGNMGMQQPIQRGLANPSYQSQALNYRPDLTGAMQSLNRVVPSVAEMDRRAAEEAARQAAIDAANAPPPSYDYGGGG